MSEKNESATDTPSKAVAQGPSLDTSVRLRAESIGRQWAFNLTTLLRARRRASGGWPGTLSEARARTSSLLHPWLESLGQPLPTHEQNETLVRVVYTSARLAWLQGRDPLERD